MAYFSGIPSRLIVTGVPDLGPRPLMTMVSPATAVLDTEVGRTDPASGHRGSTRKAHRLGSIAVIVAAVAGLTALLYFLSAQTFPADSDGATVVLEGQALAGGHLTLHGWALSVDSFWSVDALFYTVGVLIVGLKSVLVYLVPAFIAALVVLMGIVIARDGRRGAASAAAALTVVALLGLPSHYLTTFWSVAPSTSGRPCGAWWPSSCFAGVGWAWNGSWPLASWLPDCWETSRRWGSGSLRCSVRVGR